MAAMTESGVSGGRQRVGEAAHPGPTAAPAAVTDATRVRGLTVERRVASSEAAVECSEQAVVSA